MIIMDNQNSHDGKYLLGAVCSGDAEITYIKSIEWSGGAPTRARPGVEPVSVHSDRVKGRDGTSLAAFATRESEFPNAAQLEADIAKRHNWHPVPAEFITDEATLKNPIVPDALQVAQSTRWQRIDHIYQIIDPTAEECYHSVGPVHAGVLEPGQFWFKTFGESILDLDIRLGYTHRNIESMIVGKTVHEALPFVQQIAGDTPCAHALAFTQAVEEAFFGYEGEMGEEARPVDLVRCLVLELERIWHHVSSCGTLVDDIGRELPADALGAIRESLLGLDKQMAGDRLLRGIIAPWSTKSPEVLQEFMRKFHELGHSYHEKIDEFRLWTREIEVYGNFCNRVRNIGILPTAVARAIGATGPTARASGVPRDIRLELPFGAFGCGKFRGISPSHLEGAPARASQNTEAVTTGREVPPAMRGDVYARFCTRLKEVDHSEKWIKAFSESFPATPHWGNRKGRDWLPASANSQGMGIVEGPRGAVVHHVELAPCHSLRESRIVRFSAIDPSRVNWLGLKYAVQHSCRWSLLREWGRPNDLGDFPLINASFGLSYFGHDR